MKAILIDVVNKEVKEIEIGKGIDEIYDAQTEIETESMQSLDVIKPIITIPETPEMVRGS